MARIAAPRRDMASQNSRLDELVQTRGQDVARYAEPRLKIGESLRAEKGLAQDQKRPPFPDFVQGLGHGADLVFKRRASHRTCLDFLVAFCN
jgi:hypothetical protein